MLITSRVVYTLYIHTSEHHTGSDHQRNVEQLLLSYFPNIFKYIVYCFLDSDLCFSWSLYSAFDIFFCTWFFVTHFHYVGINIVCILEIVVESSSIVILEILNPLSFKELAISIANADSMAFELPWHFYYTHDHRKIDILRCQSF